MGKKSALFAFAGIMSVAVTGALAAGDGPTVMDPQGINLEFANQIELKDFEAQTGSALSRCAAMWSTAAHSSDARESFASMHGSARIPAIS